MELEVASVVFCFEYIIAFLETTMSLFCRLELMVGFIETLQSATSHFCNF